MKRLRSRLQIITVLLMLFSMVGNVAPTVYAQEVGTADRTVSSGSGSDNSGDTGNVDGSGDTGVDGSGDTGSSDGSGDTGSSDGSGDTGSDGAGIIGNVDGSGDTGVDDSSDIGRDDSGDTGSDDSGDTGSDDSQGGSEGNPPAATTGTLLIYVNFQGGDGASAGDVFWISVAGSDASFAAVGPAEPLSFTLPAGEYPISMTSVPANWGYEITDASPWVEGGSQAAVTITTWYTAPVVEQPPVATDGSDSSSDDTTADTATDDTTADTGADDSTADIGADDSTVDSGTDDTTADTGTDDSSADTGIDDGSVDDGSDDGNSSPIIEEGRSPLLRVGPDKDATPDDSQEFSTFGGGDEGSIKIIKRFCEGDNSSNNTCNGRINGVSVSFTVYQGAGTAGSVAQTISVDMTQGDGSQGQSTGADLPAGTYTACENTPAGYDSEPRPDGSTGGVNQSALGNCIVVDLTTGNGRGVLQFNNYLIVTPATLLTPQVDQGQCIEGVHQDPTVTIPGDSGDDGISYSVGSIVVGQTVTVTATLASGFSWDLSGTGWQPGVNASTATFVTAVITDTPCLTPAIPVLPSVTDGSCEAGIHTEASVTATDGSGVTYLVIGPDAIGAYSVVASLTDGYEWGNVDAALWTPSAGNTYTHSGIVDLGECEGATPLNPVVSGNECVEGTVSDPIIMVGGTTLVLNVDSAAIDGITYRLTALALSGDTYNYTVTATLSGAQSWNDLSNDWSTNGAVATYTGSFDKAECEGEGDGNITIHKAFCESDNGGNNNCTGPVQSQTEGWNVTFTVTGPQGDQSSSFDMVVTMAQNGKGTTTSGSLTPGTYTVCEVPVAGWDAQPRPEAGNGGSTGGNQTASGDCITVDVTAGNAQVKFINLPNVPETTPVTPALPIVADGSCLSGAQTDPTVTATDANGVTYVVIGPDATGAYSVVASLENNTYSWGTVATPPWTYNAEGNTYTTSGTVSLNDCTPASPVMPVTTDGTCVAGVYSAPIVPTPVTDGITYQVSAIDANGDFTVTASLTGDYEWGDTTGWTTSDEGATYTRTGHVDLSECKPTAPIVPQVTDGSCVVGVYTPPTVKLLGNTAIDGIAYHKTGPNPATGAYSVTATLEDGFTWDLEHIPTGWIGEGATLTYAGTVDLNECEDVTPLIPVVSGNECVEGTVSDPIIKVGDTTLVLSGTAQVVNGITYQLTALTLTGDTYNYTVIATLGNGQVWDLTGTDWTSTVEAPSVATYSGFFAQGTCEDADGHITIIKRFCEADNSANTNSNCNGRVEDAEGTTVTFNVYAGTATSGTPVQTIDVLIGQQGAGSQGSATGADLTEDTYTVCEVPVAGYVAVPRPGAQGGQNQTGVDGVPCITVDLGPGNNVLQYNNFASTVLTTPALPAVTDGSCLTGVHAEALVNATDGNGVTYVVTGPDATGAYSVTARLLNATYDWGTVATPPWTYDEATNSYTLSGTVELNDCTPTTPELPVVTDGSCLAGVHIDATVTATNANGVHYEVTGPDLTTGAYSVVASLTGTHEWGDVDSGWTYNEATNTYTHTGTVALGDCEEGSPIDPEVTQVACIGGELTAPSIVVHSNDNIVYSFDQADVVNGGTVLITAKVQGEYAWEDEMPIGWTQIDAETATFTVHFDLVTCTEVVPAVALVINANCTNGTLSVPTVSTETTAGITYTIAKQDAAAAVAADLIIAEFAPGDVVLITARLSDGYTWGTMPKGWTQIDSTTATYTVELDDAACELVVPATPDVSDPGCNYATSEITRPSLNLHETTGIAYTVDGKIQAGHTVVVTAILSDGYAWGTMPAGWIQLDPTTATFTHTFPDVACVFPKPPVTPEKPVKPVTPPVTTPHVSHQGPAVTNLPVTGAGQSGSMDMGYMFLFLFASVAFAVAGVASRKQRRA